MVFEYLYFYKKIIDFPFKKQKITLSGFNINAKNKNKKLIITNKENFLYANIEIVSFTGNVLTLEYNYTNTLLDSLFYKKIFNLTLNRKENWRCVYYSLNNLKITCEFVKMTTSLMEGGHVSKIKLKNEFM